MAGSLALLVLATATPSFSAEIPLITAEKKTIVVPLLDIRLKKEGNVVINPSTNHSEDKTFSATVIYPAGHPKVNQTVAEFDKAIHLKEEDGTNYYDGNNGASLLPKDALASSGKATITIKSVSNTNATAGPPPARLNASVAASNIKPATISVFQWVDDNGNLIIDWLDVQANDRLSHFRTVSGIVGSVASVPTSIVQVSGSCGSTSIDTTVIGISPICGTPNRHRTDVNLELSDTVIHEARHTWQHAQENAPLGTGASPTNDSDKDHCPEAVPLNSEAGAGDSTPIIDGTSPSTGDNSADLPYGAFCQGIFENDASAFGTAHRSK